MKRLKYQVLRRDKFLQIPNISHSKNKDEVYLIIIIVLFCIFLSTVVVFIRDHYINRIGAESTLESVAKHIMLDEDEKPTIAVVSNQEKFKETNPEVYKYVKNGDLLIVYSNRLIIYDPIKDRLVNVAPILRNLEITDNSYTLDESNQELTLRKKSQ